MTLLFADLARDSLLSFFRAQFPAQIAAVNAARPAKHPLGAVKKWTASPLVLQPETPAVGILAQTSGFRTLNWQAEADEHHLVHVYVQASSINEEQLEQDILGWTAVLLNCLWLVFRGAASFGDGVQVLLGGGSENAYEAVVFGPRQPQASQFYADVTLPLDVFYTEAV